MRKLELVAAIDLREKIRRRVAELDVQKDFIFMPSYCTGEICRFFRKRVHVSLVYWWYILITASFCVRSINHLYDLFLLDFLIY